jgi:hypothetical protein
LHFEHLAAAAGFCPSRPGRSPEKQERREIIMAAKRPDFPA